MAALVIIQSQKNLDGLLICARRPRYDLVFAVWERVHLITFWIVMASIKADHKLIRTVPYRYVRNLIYTGILIGFTGPAVIVSIWIAIIAAVLDLRDSC